LSVPAVETLRVDGRRLWQSLMDLAQIGATPRGGVCRLALTDLDRQARDCVMGWGRQAGMSITVDGIGNIFMRRAGRRPDLPPVMAGSHIDTQPTGGKFDGNYGVLAALEVMRTLDDQGVQTEAPLEVAIWTNEEGSRFVPVMMGSGVFAGAVPLATAHAAADLQGHTVLQELQRIGALGEQVPGDHPVAAYFEAHIEQGPVLEDHDTVIGVVTGVLGIRWYDCTVTGTEAHAGPTPMALRRDALQAAAPLMQEVLAIAGRHGPDGRGTVGQVQVHPNSRNVIPGRVRFSIDLRNSTDAACDAMDADIRSAVARVQASTGLSIELEPVSAYTAQAFDVGCRTAVAAAAKRLGLSAMPVVSGAGHDAVYLARLAPTGMIFVPCTNGISHNEIEDALPAHLEAGCNVLLQVLLERAGAVDRRNT
jgi:beta-ureidopropionase / N-carbamoyl-L-amino-acid hydrolase